MYIVNTSFVVYFAETEVFTLYLQCSLHVTTIHSLNVKIWADRKERRNIHIDSNEEDTMFLLQQKGLVRIKVVIIAMITT